MLTRATPIASYAHKGEISLYAQEGWKFEIHGFARGLRGEAGWHPIREDRLTGADEARRRAPGASEDGTPLNHHAPRLWPMHSRKGMGETETAVHPGSQCAQT